MEKSTFACLLPSFDTTDAHTQKNNYCGRNEFQLNQGSPPRKTGATVNCPAIVRIETPSRFFRMEVHRADKKVKKIGKNSKY